MTENQSQRKINAIQAKIKSIDEKIKSLLAQKKELEKQAQEINDQEILNIVKHQEATIETLNDDLTLAKILRKNNLTQQDIMELLAPDERKNSNQNIRGGILNE